jgi:hypothetical protein
MIALAIFLFAALSTWFTIGTITCLILRRSLFFQLQTAKSKIAAQCRQIAHWIPAASLFITIILFWPLAILGACFIRDSGAKTVLQAQRLELEKALHRSISEEIDR